ncbi:PAS domain S-box protein [Phenylobacterium sp. J426]|uniref:PAS domain S-box protein n=1 Tax=Phenylobacterium sp. J426 TaxID=2898439 RepID=UPI0021519369|nr:PAS domain S-box protein [Phenylobacterium sp. J426]MCR5876609.1 PAS domain S-box protein [Phenylobacterium sp. J426]
MDDIQLLMHRRGFAEETHFAFSYTPVRDHGGEVAGFFCPCQEITGQVLAKRALSDSEARLRGVLEGMGEAFVLLDADFRVVEINAEGLRMERRPREAVTGKSHWEAWPGTEDTTQGRLYKRAMAERVPVSAEIHHRWEEGHEAWVEVRAYPSGDGLAIFYRDISARRALEERARDEAERVQLALDAGAIVGTWVWHVLADHFTADERFARSFSLDPEHCRLGLPLDAVMESIHEDDRARVAQAIDEAIARGGAYRCEYRVRHAEGAYRWVEANGRVDLDAEGRALRFPGVLLDIEERRNTEERLRETTRRLDAILNNTREAVFLMDERQHCVYANAAAAKLTGYTYEQMQGRPLHDVIHHKKPDGSPYPLEECPIDRAFPAQAQMSGEELFVAPDGSLYPVAFTASPMLDEAGEPVGTVIEARNISEEKARTQALHDAEERYRLAARATNDAIWDWDLRADHVVWSEALTALFGYAPEQVAPTGRWWVDHIHPEDRARVDRSIHAVIEGHADTWTDEYRFRRADGSYAAILDRGHLVRDEVGRAVRFIGAMLDLTERKKAEDARQLLLRELNHRVKNLFAVVAGMVTMTAKNSTTARDMATALKGRLTALAQAHELIRSAITMDFGPATEADLLELTEALLAPHLGDGDRHRLSLSGPALTLTPTAATSLALVLHELATNAAKYGALSAKEGRLSIAWEIVGGELRVAWRETGGPRLDGPPEKSGFGSQLAQVSIERQLGGAIRYDWLADGVQIFLAVPIDRVRG